MWIQHVIYCQNISFPSISQTLGNSDLYLMATLHNNYLLLTVSIWCHLLLHTKAWLSRRMDEFGWGHDASISAISPLWRRRLCSRDISVNWISFSETWDMSVSSFMCCSALSAVGGMKGGRGENPLRNSFRRDGVAYTFLCRETKKQWVDTLQNESQSEA